MYTSKTGLAEGQRTSSLLNFFLPSFSLSLFFFFFLCFDLSKESCTSPTVDFCPNCTDSYSTLKKKKSTRVEACLLYTSDAADE